MEKNRKHQIKEFNPIKEVKAGQEAERVIWSTKVINRALAAINEGRQLKATPFYMNDVQLLKPNLLYKRTEEEINEYIKCKQDPIYFGSLCYIMTPEGLKQAKLRDYQKDYLRHLQHNRFSIFKSCRQSGKSLSMLSLINVKFANKQEKKSYFYIKDNIYYLPVFELYNLYCKQTFIWKVKYQLYKLIFKINNYRWANFIINILYKLISLIDYIDYHYIRKEYLIDNYKTVEEIELHDDIQILTDTGYKPLSHLMITKPFEIWTIKLENGYELDCADEHSIFDENFNEIYVENLSIGQLIMTDEGPKKIISLTKSSTKISMCDTTVNDENHRFYSNGILSHNSVTTAIYCLWVILFNNDKKGLILSKSGPAGVDLLKKIKDMYRFLPYYLKCGQMIWNQHEISFDNNSSISTESFSPTAGLGKTINFLILDEFAWCPPNDVELFYNNIIPTVTTISNSNVCIMSTQNGFNLFYKIWKAAEEGHSKYAPFNVDWWQVPQFNPETKQWEKRTEAWRQEQIGILGSEEDFNYQYGTEFSASDNCILSRKTLAKLRKVSVLWKPNDELNDLLYMRNKEYLVWDPEYNILEHINMKYHTSDKYYLVLVDLAEGGGGDYTVFNIFELNQNKVYKHVGRWSTNNVDIEHAALDFWIMWCQLFNNDKNIISIEWNTYGALFFQYLQNLSEPIYDEENKWRFNIPYISYNGDYMDMSSVIRYKKTSLETEVSKAASGLSSRLTSNSFQPGIRFNASNKITACSMLKLKFEHDEILTTDLITINEIENFEDKNGNGSYKASFGHDDSIMTFCQIPMLESTSKYINTMEDLIAEENENNMNNKWIDDNQSIFNNINNIYDEPFMYNDMSKPPIVSSIFNTI